MSSNRSNDLKKKLFSERSIFLQTYKNEKKTERADL